MSRYTSAKWVSPSKYEFENQINKNVLDAIKKGEALREMIAGRRILEEVSK